MAVQTIGTASSAVQNTEVKRGGQISRDDFMKLLIAQLQNQDPLSPMDNQEFAVQLATFNSLEQLVGINEKLQTLSGEQSFTSRINSAAFIGKEIVGKFDQIRLAESGDAACAYDLSEKAAKVTIKVLDELGNVIRQLDAGGQNAGVHTVAWDGKTDLGGRSPAGIYRFEVVATSSSGTSIPVSEQIRGVVTGVDLGGGEPMLQMGELRIPVSSLVSVH
jgi:flagellar basal-body rod modification protein FlgD